MPQATPQQVRRAVGRAGAGKALSLDETEALLCARGDALDQLMDVAARLRELGHGRIVTYSRKVFIPLTMLCRDHCHYCTFAKPPAKLEHPFLTPDERRRDRGSGSQDGLQGSAVHPGRPSRGTLSGRP